MYGEENIISAVIHVDETTPHLHCDAAVDRWGIYRRKTDRRQKENAQDARENFEAMQERVPHALNFAMFEPEKAQLTA